MKSSSLFILLPFFLVALCSSSSSSSSNTPSRALLAGGWNPIKNLTDPHVVEVAKFAVSEYNRQTNSITKLELSRVVKGETQIVKGINYKLDIVATNGKSYEAEVWEKLLEKSMELTSFKELQQ